MVRPGVSRKIEEWGLVVAGTIGARRNRAASARRDSLGPMDDSVAIAGHASLV
jgi:hypothetical protein